MDQRLFTYAQLAAYDACANYLELFEERFGRDGEVLLTVELAVEQASDWDWDWIARYALSPEGWDAYDAVTDPALRVYRDVMDPLWEATDAAANQAREAREEVFRRHNTNQWNASSTVLAEARGAGGAVLKDAQEAERTAQETARQVLVKVQARAFAECYIREGQVSDSE